LVEKGLRFKTWTTNPKDRGTVPFALLYFATNGRYWPILEVFTFMSDAGLCTWRASYYDETGDDRIFVGPQCIDSGTMEWLEMPKMNLTGILHWELPLWSDLKGITVGENNLSGTIPTRFQNLTKLEVFDAPSNRLKFPKRFPSSMIYLSYHTQQFNHRKNSHHFVEEHAVSGNAHLRRQFINWNNSKFVADELAVPVVMSTRRKST